MEDQTDSSSDVDRMDFRERMNQYRGKDEDEKSNDLIQFRCQLAHGSETFNVTNFRNVRELYKRVADCFEIDVNDILFCTLNSHRIDMDNLLGGQIGFDDFIFVHVKGLKKEVTILKEESSLGLTITDNGAGYAFIKRMRDGGFITQCIPRIKIGDHIETINGKSVIGSRHYEVANYLREIPVRHKFTLRLIEPQSTDWELNDGRKTIRLPNSLKNGRQTFRLSKNNNESLPQMIVNEEIIKNINELLESYLGIHDRDLAQSIYECSQNVDDPSSFAHTINKGDLSQFEFDTSFIFDLWGAITDVGYKSKLTSHHLQEPSHSPPPIYPSIDGI
ncbi:hypothetical protein SNEBB_008535 [Seison nebaliae]|nr:hypothetical protein SNEBB_008535 [Seison nebaliae]